MKRHAAELSTDEMKPVESSGYWVGDAIRAISMIPERATKRDTDLHTRMVKVLCSLYVPDVSPLAFRPARSFEISYSRFTNSKTSTHVVILVKTTTRRWTDIMLASDALCPTWVECVDLNDCKFIRFMIWFIRQVERMYTLPCAFASVFRDAVVTQHLLVYPQSGRLPRLLPDPTDGALRQESSRVVS